VNAPKQLPESRTTSAVLKWVHFYTRTLPAGLAQDRRQELRSDIYEQHVHAAGKGIRPEVVARAILLRAVRGSIADITWSIKYDRRTKTMAAPEVIPARQRLAERLAAALWGAVVVTALIGLTGSITEMIDTGGQVYGLVAWPGAASISLTIVVLTASVATLALTVAIALKHWRRANKVI
jgi:hypothetical protein